jgi:hypothetical protein
MIRVPSEYTKDMSYYQLHGIRLDASKMTEEELKEFRNSFNPDEMGFAGDEGIGDDDGSSSN